MVQETGKEAQYIRDAIWQYTQYVVVLLACLGAGVFIGYQLWGDAPSLRKELEQSVAEVNRLKNERADSESRIGVLTNRNEQCQKDLGDIQKQLSTCTTELRRLQSEQGLPQ